MFFMFNATDTCDEAICRISEGDKNALSVIYKAYGKMIISVAKQIVGNQYDAEDVLQEVMLRVLQLSNNYRRGTNPKAWILAITRNCAIDIAKKKRNNADIDTMTDDQIFSSGCFYMNDDTLFTVHEALSALSSDDCMIVKLKVFFGLSHSEIASVMDISTAAVRKRYERALQKLKNIISEG